MVSPGGGPRAGPAARLTPWARGAQACERQPRPPLAPPRACCRARPRVLASAHDSPSDVQPAADRRRAAGRGAGYSSSRGASTVGAAGPGCRAGPGTRRSLRPGSERPARPRGARRGALAFPLVALVALGALLRLLGRGRVASAGIAVGPPAALAGRFWPPSRTSDGATASIPSSEPRTARSSPVRRSPRSTPCGGSTPRSITSGARRATSSRIREADRSPGSERRIPAESARREQWPEPTPT
jgi:hypothetical protein